MNQAGEIDEARRRRVVRRAPRAIGRGAALLIGALTLMATAGCSFLPGSGSARGQQVEHSSLRIGVLPAVDVAPLRLALNNKLFENAGLQVDLVSESSEADGLRQLDAGTLDVAFASNVMLFKSAAAGAALQLQAEAYQAGTNTMALVTLPNSDYTDPSVRPAPRIAVDTDPGVGTLTTRSVLSTVGIDTTKIRFAQMPFGDMTDALKSGSVDAAWMVEPYITKAQKQLGAKILTDTARGATLNFPMSSYATSRKFADANPKTLQLFRSVLGQAQQLASNHLLVQDVLHQYVDVDIPTAALVSVGVYPTSLNPVRLQRVADMMETAGMLTTRLDVQQLLPPGMTT
jgi:NitT/TauT family transport system substrate-binding protein